jgi:hypothetical protein
MLLCPKNEFLVGKIGQNFRSVVEFNISAGSAVWGLVIRAFLLVTKKSNLHHTQIGRGHANQIDMDCGFILVWAKDNQGNEIAKRANSKDNWINNGLYVEMWPRWIGWYERFHRKVAATRTVVWFRLISHTCGDVADNFRKILHILSALSQLE